MQVKSLPDVVLVLTDDRRSQMVSDFFLKKKAQQTAEPLILKGDLETIVQLKLKRMRSAAHTCILFTLELDKRLNKVIREYSTLL